MGLDCDFPMLPQATATVGNRSEPAVEQVHIPDARQAAIRPTFLKALRKIRLRAGKVPRKRARSFHPEGAGWRA